MVTLGSILHTLQTQTLLYNIMPSLSNHSIDVTHERYFGTGLDPYK